MKKKTIWVSVTVTVIAALIFYYYSRGQGYIKIAAAGVEMQLSSGWFSKTKITSEEPVKVNVGVYRPWRLSIAAKQDGNSWRIKSSGPWSKLKRIRVKKEQTTVLKLGPPFLVKTDVRRRNGRMVLIAFSIIGQAGERYSPRVTKNARRLPAPKCKIVDEAGKILASGKFEYG